MFNAIQCGSLGMILGHRKNNGKLAYSVLFGFIAYMIAQTIVLVLVFVYAIFDPSMMELFKTTSASINVEVFKSLSIITSILYTLIILVMGVLCKKILNKGVNIE